MEFMERWRLFQDRLKSRVYTHYIYIYHYTIYIFHPIPNVSHPIFFIYFQHFPAICDSALDEVARIQNHGTSHGFGTVVVHKDEARGAFRLALPPEIDGTGEHGVVDCGDSNRF